ncbi:hypothetical protein ISN76_01110 [Dyella halodurans]|uniref:Uncharacterized protein n=1 Tax=Dyella halodurans TaxID=1920171 RepID=A0ABV9BYL3_9GAMM|nr:hypothetical protein [Dyella halodurans]
MIKALKQANARILLRITPPVVNDVGGYSHFQAGGPVLEVAAFERIAAGWPAATYANGPD